MITDKDLVSLVGFSIEKGGYYSDRERFDIVPVDKKRTIWNLYSFNEISGRGKLIKKLKDFDDLKDIYFNITFKELEIKE